MIKKGVTSLVSEGPLILHGRFLPDDICIFWSIRPSEQTIKSILKHKSGVHFQVKDDEHTESDWVA